MYDAGTPCVWKRKTDSESIERKRRECNDCQTGFSWSELRVCVQQQQQLTEHYFLYHILTAKTFKCSFLSWSPEKETSNCLLKKKDRLFEPGFPVGRTKEADDSHSQWQVTEAKERKRHPHPDSQQEQHTTRRRSSLPASFSHRLLLSCSLFISHSMIALSLHLFTPHLSLSHFSRHLFHPLPLVTMSAQKSIRSYFRPKTTPTKRQADETELTPSKRSKPLSETVNGASDDGDKTESTVVSVREPEDKVLAEIKRQVAATSGLCENIGPTWFLALREEFTKKYFVSLSSFLEDQRKSVTVYPPVHQVYAWTHHSTIKDVKVVILGQDPYHGPNQAHGLSFSVCRGVEQPPSLKNIFRELQSDIKGFRPPSHGDLTGWAKQGVLLLNTCLTVKAHNANSHSNRGWEKLTDAVIKWLDRNSNHLVFMLWGNPAQVNNNHNSFCCLMLIPCSSFSDRKRVNSLTQRSIWSWNQLILHPFLRVVDSSDVDTFLEPMTFCRKKARNRLTGSCWIKKNFFTFVKISSAFMERYFLFLIHIKTNAENTYDDEEKIFSIRKKARVVCVLQLADLTITTEVVAVSHELLNEPENFWLGDSVEEGYVSEVKFRWFRWLFTGKMTRLMPFFRLNASNKWL